jgi:hypothetical protein
VVTSGDEVKNSSAPHIFLDSPRYLEARPMEVLREVGNGSRYSLTIRPGCSCPQRARSLKQGKAAKPKNDGKRFSGRLENNYDSRESVTTRRQQMRNGRLLATTPLKAL